MKQRRFAKVLSWILAALLVISLLPTSMLQVRAEEGETSNRAWEWTRLAGKNRYETTVLGTQEVYEEGSCSTIIVAAANGQKFPDALAGSALAGVYECPILLTHGEKLSAEPKAEIQRLAAPGCKVLILGGTGAVTETVENAIKGLGIEGLTTERVAGTNREATAEAVFDRGLEAGGFKTKGTVIITTGYAFADVLSISPYAYASKTPIVLVKKGGSMNSAIKAIIKKIDPAKAILVGGNSAVNSDSEAWLTNQGIETFRLAGDNRYVTSAEIMKWELGLMSDAAIQPEVEMTIEGMGIATGTSFPDALGAASLLGKTASPLLLVADNNKKNIAATQANIDELIAPYAADMTKGYIFGGTGAVSAQIEGWLNDAVPTVYTVDEILEVMKDYQHNDVSNEVYIVRGVVTKSVYNSQYKNFDEIWLQNDDGTVTQAFELYRAVLADTIDGDYSASNALVGKTVTCKGYLKRYNNTYEMAPAKAVSPTVIKVEETELTDQQKVNAEASDLSITPTTYSEATELTLPTPKTYTDVQIDWESDSEYAVVSEGKLLITIPTDEDKTVNLKATLSLNEATAEKTFELTLLATPPTVYTVDEILEVMKDYQHNDVSNEVYTVRGVVTKSTYKSSSFEIWLQNDNGTTAQAFELYKAVLADTIEGDYTASDALVGRTVTCEGYLKRYNNTYEMAPANSVNPTIIKIEGEAPQPGEDLVEDKEYTVDELLAAMVNYIANQTSAVECTVTGVATSSTYNENHSSYTIWLQSNDGATAQAFKLYSVALAEGIEGDYTAENALAGKVVTCRGYVKLYNNEYEMPYLGADSSPTGEAYTPQVTKIEDGEQPPEVTDQDKVDYEAGKLSLQTLYTQETVVTLPTPEKYEDVQIVWASDSEFAVIDQEAGTMTITLPEEGEVTANVTATLSLGTATPAEQAFVLTIRNPGDEEVLTVDEILAIMADYTSGQISEVEYVVRGVVTSSSYKSNYNSYTIWLQNNDGTTAKAFELYSVGLDESITDDYTASNALVGKIVTCKGYLQLYGKTYEMPFLKAEQSPTGEAYTPNIIKVEDGEAPPEPGEDLVEDKEYTVDGVLAAMANYIEGQTSAVECTVTGVATSSSYNSKYSSYTIWLQNDDGSVAEAFQLYSVTLADGIEGDYTAENALAGKTVTCRGYVKVYDGKYEMPYLGAESSPTGEAYTPVVTNVTGGEEPPVFEDLVEDKEYTVDELLAAMANYPADQVSGVECTVTGVASSSSYRSNFNSYNIWLKSDDGETNKAFYLYSVAIDESIEGDFTESNALAGKVVTCRGYVKYYNGDYEMPYLGADSSPTGEAYTPVVSKIEDGEEPPVFEDHVEDKEYTVDELLAAMSNYPDGQISAVECTVTGVATSSEYNSRFGSYTIWLQNNDGTVEQAFELYSAQLGEGIEGDYTADNAFAGKTVTCRGYVKLYGTTYEMAYISATQSSPMITKVEGGEEPPAFEDHVEDKEYSVDELLAAMENYPDGQVSAVECTVTGVATSSSYNSRYGSYTIWLQNNDGTVEQAFELYSAQLGEGIEGDWTAADAFKGCTVTCRGYVKLYGTTYEMAYISATDSSPVISSIVEPERDDQEKVDYEAGKLSLKETYTAAEVVTLPTPEKYEDVQIAWVSDSQYAIVDETAGTLTITLPEEGTVTANVTATLSLGTATATVPFVLTIKAPAVGGVTWTKIAFADIQDGDVIAITATYEGTTWVLSTTERGTNGQPLAVSTEISGDTFTTEEIAGYGLTAGTVDTGRTFVIYDNAGQYLYATNNNNGMRFGTPQDMANVAFTVQNDYLFNVNQARYIGVYRPTDGNPFDWRCYTSVNNNIKDETIEFWKGEASATPEPSEQEKVNFEAENLTLPEEISEAGPLTLPTPKKYNDVQIAWVSDSELAVVDETAGTLTITLPEEDTPINVTATLSLGGASVPKNFAIIIKAAGEEPETITWTKVAWEDILDGDTIAITATFGGKTYVLSTTETGKNGQPMGVVVEPAEDVLETLGIDGYGFVVGTEEAGRNFEVYNKQNVYLHCIADNNGVRLGESEELAFTLTNGYLYHVGQGRFVGVYNRDLDWRCYTSINSNISGETIEFWKADLGGEEPPEMSDEEKVEFEASKLAFQETTFEEAKTVDLPVPLTYTDVTVAWVSDSQYAVVDETAGTLTITLPEQGVITANVTATLSLKGATATANFELTIKAKEGTSSSGTETIVSADQGYANAQIVEEIVVGNIKITFDIGTGGTSPAYYDTGTGFRVYKGGFFTISTVDHSPITGIVITFSGSSNAECEAGSGTYTWDGGTTGTWTGSEESVTFSVTVPKHVRLQQFVVTYGE